MELLGTDLHTGSDKKAKPTKDVVAGKEVIGLYFSAHWCPPCRRFTPELAKTYTALIAAGKSIEIVFVSSDRDEASFDEYYAEQPWAALPYAAREAKAALSKKYKVSGIPTLVLLDGATGKTLTTDGVERVMGDPTGAEFPWRPKSVLELLGGLEGELLASPAAAGDGDDVAVSELWGKKKIGLYFSAHWCPPCKAFTPKLIDAYKALRSAGRTDFEFVFVSSDKSTSEFSDYFKDMPWLGIPPGDARKAALSSHFGVQGIPTFVVLDEHGAVINANARGAVAADPTCARFPWAPSVVADLEEPDGINSTPSLVAFLDGLDADAQAAALAALTAAAQPYADRARASGDASPFLFFASTSADGDVAPQVRKLAGLEAASQAGVATLILLDLDDDGALYKSAATAVDASSIGALLGGYEAKTLERTQIQPPN